MKVEGLRWYIIGLVGLSTVINFIDRSAINIMWPYIYKDFGIADIDNKNALALITSFFLAAYALGQTSAGKIMDAIGTRLGMTYSIVMWSISIGLHATAKTLFSFNIFRFLLGFSEAGNWPGATKNNAEWFPAKERAVAQGIFGASTAIGSVIAGPVIAILFLSLGWRWTFACIAELGFIWVVPWLIINKVGPANHPWIKEEEKVYISEALENDISEISTKDLEVYTWLELLTQKNTWGIISSRFFIDPVWWLFITWLPTFLKEQFMFDIKQIGMFSWFPFLLAAIGGILGGYYSLRKIKGGQKATSARKSAISYGCIIMFVSLALMAFYINNLKDQPLVVMFLIGLSLFGFQFLISNLQTLPSDYYNGKNVGSIAGMGGTAAVIGTLITTWIVPIITQTSYTLFFLLGCLLVPLAWLCITFIHSDKKAIKLVLI